MRQQIHFPGEPAAQTRARTLRARVDHLRDARQRIIDADQFRLLLEHGPSALAEPADAPAADIPATPDVDTE